MLVGGRLGYTRVRGPGDHTEPCGVCFVIATCVSLIPLYVYLSRTPVRFSPSPPLLLVLFLIRHNAIRVLRSYITYYNLALRLSRILLYVTHVYIQHCSEYALSLCPALLTYTSSVVGWRSDTDKKNAVGVGRGVKSTGDYIIRAEYIM